jgi:uncharacterized protein (TIGR02466 family)
MNLEPIFVTGILSANVPQILANNIENLIVSKLKDLEYKDTNYTDYFKPNKILNKNEISDLIYEIEKYKTIYEQHTGWNKSHLNDFWVQDYKKNDIHRIHNHGRNELSIVYWVRANQHAGEFVLHNPSPYISLWHDNTKEGNPFNSLVKYIKPEKGKIIIFPSFINHEVLPGSEECIRTTIAFNYSSFKV